jgi:hypothetical protein
VSGSEQIVVTVHPDGSVTATTRNVVGARCLDYITVLEDMLEAETTSSHYTADYTRTVDSTPLRTEHVAPVVVDRHDT